MPKTRNPRKTAARARQFYSLQPWQCRVIEDRAEILAFVEAHGWQPVLTVNPTPGATAEALATYVTGIINRHQTREDLLQEAMSALATCLEEDEMTYTSEQAADRVITRIKRMTE